MDLQLRNRLALVTGSTAGIGFAIAESLTAEGARVIVNGRTDDAVDRAVAQLTEATSCSVLGFAGDLSDAAAAERLSDRFPDVEILVNNLGIFEPKPFEEIPDADWRRLFEVNVLSGVRLARLYLPAMRRRDWGRIIFISSESAVHIPSEMIHYGVSKIAQIGVARGLAEAVAGTGKSWAEFEGEFFATVRPTSLLRRFATPNEVASLVAYVASPLAAATTGAALRVDGGVIKSAL